MRKFPVILIVVSFFMFSGCENKTTAENQNMEPIARKAIQAYLAKNGLPMEGLNSFNSSAQPKPDFAFLYTGENRCIEFVVYCGENDCTEWHKYPYDDHGEICPGK